MVVATGVWVKNVITYPLPVPKNAPVVTMTAKAVLTCRPNSHPFQERTLLLDQPVKVGRSVPKTKAAPNNAIFDCKVLSRHHALLWYDCGKFYLQDTKSSNGTFVNNNRLPCNETEPHEVSSGDIVQFGVDVVENNRKITHGCIIATLKLYLPDGKEAKASPSIAAEEGRLGVVPLDELYKLNQVIQEAARREQCLEDKLSALGRYTEEVKMLVDYTWQVRVDEERLLSRVATLEKQLVQAGKNSGDDRIREEFSKLQEEKIAYQEAAKEALQKLHSEKLEAEMTATEKERARETAEQEMDLAKKLLAQAQLDLEDVARRLIEQQQKSNNEKSQFQQRESELEAKLKEESRKIEELREKIEQINAQQMNDSKESERRDVDKCDIYNEDELKMKEDSETCTLNKANGESADETTGPAQSEQKLSNFESHRCPQGDGVPKYVTFNVENGSEDNLRVDDKTGSESDQTDAKTLKYQYQHELKKQVDHLEATIALDRRKIKEMEVELQETRQLFQDRVITTDSLKKELQNLEQQLKASKNECKQLRNKWNRLKFESKAQAGVQTEECENDSPYTSEQVGALEEELVLMKEKYASLADDKTALNKKLITLTERYNTLCNRSYNTMFFYIAPLVLMVLYLLISSITS